MNFPPRNAFNRDLITAAEIVQEYYSKKNEDPGFQSYFEGKFCSDFTSFMGGGYSDAVSSGTSALYIAIRSLNLPNNSSVLVSPITDPGTINAIILNNLKPKLVDSSDYSYNLNPSILNERITNEVSAIMVVHLTGEPVFMPEVMNIAKKNNLKVIEDCSQAHGAVINNKKVGNFGDISAFSMMSRKTISVNGTAGMVFTKNHDLYKNSLALSDRGKPIWEENYIPNDPSNNLFPSLNFNLDEFSSALGIISMKKIQKVIKSRRESAEYLKAKLNQNSDFFSIRYDVENSSPFVIPVFLNVGKQLPISVYDFAKKLNQRGIPLNPRYKFLVNEWNYVKEYLFDDYFCQNAYNSLERSFILYINENYKFEHMDHIISELCSLENEIIDND